MSSSSNRVGGVPPESNKPRETDAKLSPGQPRRVGKIEKVEQVDNEETKRRQQFQRAVDEAEQKDEGTIPQAPGPVDPAFYSSPQAAVTGAGEQAERALGK